MSLVHGISHPKLVAPTPAMMLEGGPTRACLGVLEARGDGFFTLGGTVDRKLATAV